MPKVSLYIISVIFPLIHFIIMKLWSNVLCILCFYVFFSCGMYSFKHTFLFPFFYRLTHYISHNVSLFSTFTLSSFPVCSFLLLFFFCCCYRKRNGSSKSATASQSQKGFTKANALAKRNNEWKWKQFPGRIWCKIDNGTECEKKTNKQNVFPFFLCYLLTYMYIFALFVWK